ncbi:unnamed protein product, partial [Callosobruchus maculatus]
TLDAFIGIFDEEASVFVDILKKNAGRKDVPLYMLAIRCHLDDVCGTTMGVRMNLQTTNDNLGETVQRLIEIFGRKVFMIRYQSSLIWNHSNDKKCFLDMAKRINGLCVTVVRKKIKDYKEKQQKERNDYVFDDGSAAEKKVMLDLLIENSDLTEEELREEVTTTLAG